MVTFLFWNTNNRPVFSLIGKACRENEVDVVVLAECDSPEVISAINSESEFRFFEPPNLSNWLKFFTRYPSQSFESWYDGKRVAMRRVRPPLGKEVLMIAAHLPSKLHQEEWDQYSYARSLAEEIVQQESRIGHRNSFLIGDLNMDPFEPGIVAAEGLHGIMDRKIASRLTRTVQGKDWSFFYNPMWNHFGDDDGVPGTYYYHRGRMVTHFWHIWDQVLLRPELLEFFAPGGVRILSRIGSTDLVGEGRINGTLPDHLPILLRLELEKDAWK